MTTNQQSIVTVLNDPATADLFLNLATACGGQCIIAAQVKPDGDGVALYITESSQIDNPDQFQTISKAVLVVAKMDQAMLKDLEGMMDNAGVTAQSVFTHDA